MGRDWIIDEIKKSGLRGRGGRRCLYSNVCVCVLQLAWIAVDVQTMAVVTYVSFLTHRRCWLSVRSEVVLHAQGVGRQTSLPGGER